MDEIQIELGRCARCGTDGIITELHEDELICTDCVFIEAVSLITGFATKNGIDLL